jgi:Winged helix-turn helix
MTVITMSRNELTRLPVLIDVADGRLSVADATGLIGVGRRQIYRLLHAFRADGADGLISRKRGGPSNRALGSVFRETVLAIGGLPVLPRARRHPAAFRALRSRARGPVWRPCRRAGASSRAGGPRCEPYRPAPRSRR